MFAGGAALDLVMLLLGGLFFLRRELTGGVHGDLGISQQCPGLRRCRIIVVNYDTRLSFGHHGRLDTRHLHLLNRHLEVRIIQRVRLILVKFVG